MVDPVLTGLNFSALEFTGLTATLTEGNSGGVDISGLANGGTSNVELNNPDSSKMPTNCEVDGLDWTNLAHLLQHLLYYM